jgi:hypothetical protein
MGDIGNGVANSATHSSPPNKKMKYKKTCTGTHTNKMENEGLLALLVLLMVQLAGIFPDYPAANSSKILLFSLLKEERESGRCEGAGSYYYPCWRE